MVFKTRVGVQAFKVQTDFSHSLKLPALAATCLLRALRMQTLSKSNETYLQAVVGKSDEFIALL
jgi:hypothetical protein